METYLLKCENSILLSITEEIKSKGGEIVYASPVLPILGVNISQELKLELLDNFKLDYIIENPENGMLQDVNDMEGAISSVVHNSVTVLPNLNFHRLRNGSHSYTGWGTTVAVLDSGVSENWIAEHHDFTGYGSTPSINHGTKVANIIRLAAPGSKILSYKICHDSKVNMINVLSAIDAAVVQADIINLSIGFNASVTNCVATQPCVLCDIINHYTQNNGKLFVTTAGNLGMTNSIQCPGNSQEAVTVGSLNRSGEELASYSSLGVPGIKKPNIITSGSIYFNQEYDQGTSFAAPIITGICASLFHGVHKDVSTTKHYLYSSAKDLGLPEHYQGFGMFDLEKMLEVVCDDQGDSEIEGQK
ncbi:S8/S53 family peptidase [Bacillus cereus]|uniref:S8 family peptidase n=1 Tax=Bacillus cereus TaxID=1396 RepID=UPI002405BBAF|nr:S8/S53 family peptidase [Bacillus cereus]MDF9540335.1 S8/S53 family peptidase [Bacillus cereus]MDF9583458.1 S8/S53 family peptidase [Bacillus cereus]MDF9583526.1 S8/S53 family peptidase [Bacillus cereus]MDG1590349.1 S8/S53 family peptidase [Bacillus cereus]